MGTAPIIVSSLIPFLNNIKVGMLLIPKSTAVWKKPKIRSLLIA